jgi:hypothetical protein
MSSCEKSTEQPIAAEGGLERRANDPRSADPYAALDDLMVVVEALCPKWPERESSLKDGKFVL